MVRLVEFLTGNETRLKEYFETGESWTKLKSPSNKELQGRWVTGKSVDLTDLSQEHEYIGHPVARDFDSKLFLGIVVAHYNGEDDEFWRVCHWDGDVEDLSLSELKKAMSRKMLRDALKQKPHGVGQKRVSAGSDSSLSIASILSPKKRSVAREKRKPASKEAAKDDKSGSEYEPEEQESSESSSDSDFVDQSSKAPVGKRRAKTAASSSEDEEDDIDETPPLPPKFVPATWGEDSPVSHSLVLC